MHIWAICMSFVLLMCCLYGCVCVSEIVRWHVIGSVCPNQQLCQSPGSHHPSRHSLPLSHTDTHNHSLSTIWWHAPLPCSCSQGSHPWCIASTRQTWKKTHDLCSSLCWLHSDTTTSVWLAGKHAEDMSKKAWFIRDVWNSYKTNWNL